MARKRRYPSWNDWQGFIEVALSEAMKHSELQGYRINSAATNKYIAVKSPDEPLGSMPYVQAMITAVQDGWDSEMSAQEDYQGYEYADLGGTKQLKSPNFVRERVTWTIEAWTQTEKEAIAISQTLKRYFNTMGELTVIWQGEELTVYTMLNDYVKIAFDADRTGKVEFFRVSWDLTLKIISELIEPDVIVKSIQEVVAETANSLSADDTTNDSTSTKTFTND